MNKAELSFFEKAADNFFKFAKETLPAAGTNAAVAAVPMIAMATYSGAMFAIGVMNRDPLAVEAAYHTINNPESSTWLAALAGELPFEAANRAYQYATGAVATGVAVGSLSKVIEKFGSLREEAGHLRKENEMLRREYWGNRAGSDRTQDTLANRLSTGLGNMNTKIEQREQATRTPKPGPGMR